MATNKIRIQVAGKENGIVRFRDFIDVLNATIDILNRLDHLINRSPSPTLYFRLTKLQYSSPAVVESEAVPLLPSLDVSVALFDRFLRGLSEIKNERAPDDFDSEMLESYRRLGATFRKHISELTYSSNNTYVELGEDLELKIKKILGDDEILRGRIRGVLETLNIHRGANRFIIYPIAGAEKIECHFPPSLKQEAIQAIDHYIEVGGKLKYKQRDKFPYAIDVDQIEVFPDEDKLPTLLDLHGIAPNATGELSSEEFVNRIRIEEW